MVKQDDQTKKALEAILRNANRLERLAKDILDVSKIDSHRLTLNKELFNLNEKIKYVVDDITNQIKKNSSNNNVDNNNIQIIFKSKESNDIFVDADEKKIYQVISNLLVNAVKFTKQGTISITTGTSTDKREVIVKIKDTGNGIPTPSFTKTFLKIYYRFSRRYWFRIVYI